MGNNRAPHTARSKYNLNNTNYKMQRSCMALVAVCVCAYVTVESKPSSLRDSSHALSKRSTSDHAFLRSFLVDFLRELINLQDSYINNELLSAKRAASYWQTQAEEALPRVQTRLSTFGSKITPDRNAESPNGFKAMRYGRRR